MAIQHRKNHKTKARPIKFKTLIRYIKYFISFVLIVFFLCLHKEIVDGRHQHDDLSTDHNLSSSFITRKGSTTPVVETETSVTANSKVSRSYSWVEADTFQQTCPMSLNEMVISMAKYSVPHGSTAWTKMKRILSQAKYYHVPDDKRKNNIFSDSTKRIMEILEGYGLVRIKNETIDSDIVTNNDTILVEYSIFHHDVHPVHCTGSKCHTMPRISLQTEQVKALHWAPDFIRSCDSSPNCILWDFSKINYDWAKMSLNASESIMIVPLLFHDRLETMYPSGGEDELLPHNNRTLDISFFGLITKRRKEFHQRFIQGINKTLSPYKVQYRKLMFVGPQVEAYKRSKICLVLHAYLPDSAGEYHRISDFKRFGCIPVMESFSDIETQRILAACAGIVFADYENLANTVVSVLNRVNQTNASVLRRNQLEVDRWWREGIQWSSFLETVLGPSTIPR